MIGSTLRHILTRFPRYGVQIGTDETAQFFSETDVTNEFVNRSMNGLLRALYDELDVLRIQIPADTATEDSVHDEGIRLHLHHNIDEEDVVEEEQRIAEISTKFLAAADALSWVSDVRIDGRKELRDFVLAHTDEERSRHYEGLVHSLQSKYDTYIKNTTLEGRHSSLPRLRGHVSLALHLLEMGTQLVHFYERHENDIRYESAKARIARIVDKSVLLDRLVNYCQHFAHRALESGRRFAEEALRTFVRVQRLELSLSEGMALHARPISLIVKIVARYGTHVEMEVEGETANAGSIMELIMLIGGHSEARRFVFRGDSRPLQDIRMLFEHGLGEEGLDVLPAQLDYLRG
jgi:phosphotransferase system HPr (HPr) family protein